MPQRYTAYLNFLQYRIFKSKKYKQNLQPSLASSSTTCVRVSEAALMHWSENVLLCFMPCLMPSRSPMDNTTSFAYETRLVDRETSAYSVINGVRKEYRLQRPQVISHNQHRIAPYAVHNPLDHAYQRNCPLEYYSLLPKYSPTRRFQCSPTFATLSAYDCTILKSRIYMRCLAVCSQTYCNPHSPSFYHRPRTHLNTPHHGIPTSTHKFKYQPLSTISKTTAENKTKEV